MLYRYTAHQHSSRLTAFALLFVGVVVQCAPAQAMVELEEAQMSGVTGTGLAFVFDDFSMRQAPTSYIELTGSPPTTQAAAAGWARGDARYYGISMTSGSVNGTDWFGNGCTGGALACPLGLGDGDFGVDAFASVYDPYVLRVFEYSGFDYQGDWLGVDPGDLANGAVVKAIPTILEFKGPENTDIWRWSFWGELEVGRPTTGTAYPDTYVAGTYEQGTCNNSGSSAAGCVGSGADFLQSQTIILGKPVASGTNWRGLDAGGADLGYELTPTNKPSILRVMQTQNDADRTLGLTYQSAISGDLRFSVRQTTASPDALHWVPDFEDTEGLYFKNVDAFLPIGTLHYQALTFSGVSEYDASANSIAPTQNGNFTVELTAIPNNPNIYSHFYCGATNGSCALAADGSIDAPNPDTHGYVRWGNWCTSADCTSVIDPYTAIPGAGVYDLPTGTSQGNGIYYVGTPNPAVNNNATVNLGISRIEGMLIQHLKITTLGAGS